MAGVCPSPGVIRGYGSTRRAQTHPSGKAASPRPRRGAAQSGDARAGAARCGRPDPHPRPAPPQGPHPASCLPKAWRGQSLQRGFFSYFYSLTFENSPAIPRVALLISSSIIFIFPFYFVRGEQSLQIVFYQFYTEVNNMRASGILPQ